MSELRLPALNHQWGKSSCCRGKTWKTSTFCSSGCIMTPLAIAIQGWTPETSAMDWYIALCTGDGMVGMMRNQVLKYSWTGLLHSQYILLTYCKNRRKIKRCYIKEKGWMTFLGCLVQAVEGQRSASCIGSLRFLAVSLKCQPQRWGFAKWKHCYCADPPIIEQSNDANTPWETEQCRIRTKVYLVAPPHIRDFWEVP